jgi:hypothetical protein
MARDGRVVADMKKEHAVLLMNAPKTEKIVGIVQLTSLIAIDEEVMFDTCSYKQMKKKNKAIKLNNLGIYSYCSDVFSLPFI